MRRYPHHRWYAALVAAGICLALAGCGSSPDQTASTSKTGGQATDGPGQPAATSGKQGNTKPCDLLTVDELKAATGFTAQAGKAKVMVGVSRCEWPVEYGSTGDATVSVDLLAPNVFSSPPDDQSRWVKVTGVGDEALWSMDQTTLYVHSAQQYISVLVGVSDDAKQQVIAKALALKVLERL